MDVDNSQASLVGQAVNEFAKELAVVLRRILGMSETESQPLPVVVDDGSISQLKEVC